MSSKVITLIDDNEDHALVTKRILQSQGYRVIYVQDGERALDSLMDAPPHLILLDILMPVVHGFEVLKKIKSTSYLRRIPVVMFSSLNEKKEVRKAIAMGAEDYILKPIKSFVLAEKVKKVLDQSGFELDVELDPEQLINRLRMNSRARIIGLGELTLILNSDLFLGKDMSFKFDSELFKIIGVKDTKIKSIKSSIISSGHYKFKNEFTMMGLGEHELQNIRRWINSNLVMRRDND